MPTKRVEFMTEEQRFRRNERARAKYDRLIADPVKCAEFREKKRAYAQAYHERLLSETLKNAQRPSCVGRLKEL
jgi:hypothetical protein